MHRVNPVYPEFFENAALTERAASEENRSDGDDLLVDDLAADDIEPDSVSAPWIGIEPAESECEVLIGGPRAAFPPWAEIESRATVFTVGEDTVDAIAAYFPWHFFFENWGVRIYESHFLGFVEALAELARCDPAEVAPYALRQVLHHEWTHFAWEVAATEFEDLVNQPLYESYSRYRYADGRSVFGNEANPLEEATATWAEVVYARSARISGRRKPRRYLEAVRRLNVMSPPGYRDFDLCRSAGESVASELAGRIADRPVATSRWGTVEDAEVALVPVFWVGADEALNDALGLLTKAVAAPSPRDFERWLRRIGADIDVRRGSGSHRSFEWQGRRSFYETSGDRIARKTATNLAKFFGLGGPHELFRHVQGGIIPHT